MKEAQVAELVDAHGSGPCASNGVEVRVFSWAPEFQKKDIQAIGYLFFNYLVINKILGTLIALSINQ